MSLANKLNGVGTKIKSVGTSLKYNWNKTSENDSLSLKEMAGFSASAMGQDIFWGLRGLVYTFYIAVVGLSPTVVGTMFLLAGIWDAINDPIMGMLIDRTNTKWGKLRPYMLFTSFPIAIFTILSFVSPPFYGTGRIIFVYVTYIMWEMSYTISDVPFGALPSVITDNSVERSKLITMSRYGSNIGVVLPGIVSFLIPFIGVEYMGTIYIVSAVILSCLGALLFSVSFFTIKERVPPIPNKQSFREMFNVIKQSKPTIIMVVSEMLSMLSSAASYTTFFFFYFTFKEGIDWKILQIFDSSSQGLGLSGLIGVLTGIPTFIAMAFTPKLAKKMSMKSLMLISGIAKSIAYLGIFVLCNGGFNKINLIIMMALLMLSSIPNDMTSVARKTMSADSLDYIEWKTGKRAEGLVGSFMGMAIKLKIALAGFVGGYLLTWCGLSGADSSNPASFWGLSPNLGRLFILYTLVPAGGSLLATIPYFFYDFVGVKQKKIIAELNVMRQARKTDSNNEENDGNED